MAETPARAAFEPEFYRDLFYAIDNPALVIDTGFTIRDANPAAAEFLDYGGRRQLVGTDVQSILVNADVLSEVAESIAENDRWEGEAKIRTRDNRIFMGTGTAVPIEQPGGERLIAGLFSNLTRRRRYARSVKVLNRVLRHNLRNEINVVLGHLERLRGRDDAVAAVDSVYDILENLLKRADRARKLELLIRDEETRELSTVALSDHLRRAVADARQRYGDAEIAGPAEPEPVQVIGDDTVSEVFHEVIENAVEHNESDRPAVEVSLAVSEDSAVVTVADDGPGVDPRHADRMFGREETDQLHHGSGMGLFFVDQVMQVYGGEAWIEENEPAGTRVKLRFPRVD